MKKGFYFLVLALFSLTLASCSNKSNNETAVSESDSLLITGNGQDTADYYGIYQGKIPVKDGTELTYESTLSLNHDRTFALHTADGKDEFDEQGNYAVADGILTLFLTSRDPYYYLVEEGKLRILDDNKEPVSKDEAFVLTQVEKFGK